MGMTDTATRLIKRFGQAATLSKPGEPTGDPWNPVIGPPTAYTVAAAVMEYTLEERATTLITEGDLQVFMTAGVEPSTSDKLVIGDIEYSIFRVGILGPDGVVICYELQVRT